MAKPILQIGAIDLAGKRVIIRADLNVPVTDSEVTSDARIRASLPTIELALAANASVVVMSHLGRPTEGVYNAESSLAPVARRLGQLLNREVRLLAQIEDCASVALGEIALLENVRFFAGEKGNEDALAKRYAEQCEVFVHDAFGTAHRAQASTYGIAKFAPTVCAGLLLGGELEALNRALAAPKQPMFAIVGGSKVSTKLEVLNTLAAIADNIIVGGGIANTFIAAAGYNIGTSLYEPDLLNTAREIAAQVTIPIPVDVVVAKALDEAENGIVRLIDEVGADEMILDIGPQTARDWATMLETAGTVLWNGPLGVFEFEQFGEGTRILAEAIAASEAFSIAGGGDTLAAIDKYEVSEKISYTSTGGGAFLEFVEGKTLPAVEILQLRNER
ncbi:MAG: phosphoglycerate kinase [Pseudomonadales bacterium]|nr:phosphoglycerate kinase [Pseudomonadales bacterium]